MSILIKGAKIPKNCVMCFYINECKAISGGMTPEQIHNCTEQRHERCPLVEIPPHGRLIDKDKLEDVFWDILNEPEKYDKPLHCMMLELQTAPTVIESEEEK